MTILEFLKADLPSSEAKVKTKEGLPSNEAKARIKNGSIKINGDVVKDPNFEVGEPIIADKVLATLTKEQLEKISKLKIAVGLKFEELFGLNLSRTSLVYDLFVNHICIKVSKTDFFVSKLPLKNIVEEHFNDSTHYGDGQHYFNCSCGQQYCVSGSQHLEIIECGCGESTKIIFDTLS